MLSTSTLLDHVRSARGLATIALAAIGLHVLDDNFLRPEPGASPSGHLASGLVPVALLAAAGFAFPLLRAGLRATLALTFGALGVAVGVPGAYYLLDGSASGDHYTSPLAIAGGLVLLLLAPVTLWRARRADGGRRRRYGRRSLHVAVGAATVLAVGSFVVFPVAFSYGYTHIGKTGAAAELGVAHERVVLTTSDSIELTARYVPSRNRAAIVVFPGASAVQEAKVLARNGYGVLLLDPRGQGGSGGDLVRWAGDRDLLAGAAYLRTRADVDPERIGGYGSSVGGEILLEAAAQSEVFKAVVSEGAGLPIGDGAEVLTGAEKLLTPALTMLRAATTVFSNHAPQPPIADRIGLIAPRAVFLVYADPGMGGEAQRQPTYFAAAGQPKRIWKVPGAEHTGALDARPQEFERRVVGFYDDILLRER
jgi:uncharacterized protein